MMAGGNYGAEYSALVQFGVSVARNSQNGALIALVIHVNVKEN